MSNVTSMYVCIEQPMILRYNSACDFITIQNNYTFLEQQLEKSVCRAKQNTIW